MGIRLKKVNMVIREAVKAIKKKGIKANDIRRENMGPSSFSLEARVTGHIRSRKTHRKRFYLSLQDGPVRRGFGKEGLIEPEFESS